MAAKSAGIEGGPADEPAVDLLLGEELRRVGRRHRAAVEDPHAACAAAAPKRSASRARRNACASTAISGVAARPVPIAQTGS